MVKNRVIHDAFLDEFLYNLIYGATRVQRDRFPEEHLGVFNSASAAKRFISKAILEQKLYFLSLLGVRWHMVFGETKTMQKDLREVAALIREKKLNEAGEALVAKNIFVFSGEQFVDCIGIMASLDHHKTYSFNVEMQKTAYHLNQWKKAVKYGNFNEVSERTENLENLVSFVLKNILNGISIEANHSIKLRDLCVLLYLKLNKHKYVAHEKICDHFGGFFKKKEITNAIRILRDKELIKMSSLTIKKEYMITALGINKLNQYISKTLATNF